MVLSDKTILRMLKEGTLGISPVTEEQIQPASVDNVAKIIRLGMGLLGIEVPDRM